MRSTSRGCIRSSSSTPASRQQEEAIQDRHETRFSGSPSETLAEQAYILLEEMIVDRKLEPGQMISEGEISRELGLGRTPVREAIARLKYIGFVEVHHRRGVLVSNLDPIRHLELLEVRRPLELDIARHIIDRGTEDDVAELDAIMGRVNQAAERGERLLYFKAKRDLHDAEVRMARNSVLTATITSLHAQSRRFWQAYEPTSSFKKGAVLHSRIVDGVRKRAPDAATAGVEDLFTFLQNITIEVVRRSRFT